ncbi:MAG: hypothetical protein IIB02_09375 [Thaumarchaeota archaeon]|nr:hypothetical protein [Nitrososphaerota archaeon]
MRGNQKIIIDTNVIVAASIIENVKELGIEVSHRFYGQSRQLFSIFIKRPEEKIGICTPTVRSEAFKVLSRAVKDSFIPPNLEDIKRKEIFYNDAVALVNTAEHRMRYLFGFLLHKTPNPNLVNKNHKLVKDMSFYLKDLWHTKYRGRERRISESQKRSKNIKTELYWVKEQKNEVFYAHNSQINIEARQLGKFVRKWPNKNDERILAETITVKNDYERIDEKYEFYIASCDTGFFSPAFFQNTVSNLVTTEIKERFEIICNVPKVIQWIIDPSISYPDNSDEEKK